MDNLVYCVHFCGCCSMCGYGLDKYGKPTSLRDNAQLDLRTYIDGTKMECNVFNPYNPDHKCEIYGHGL